jgi:hypothetical protein
MTDAQYGERIARMETELQYLKRDVAALTKKVDEIEVKLDQILDTLTEAKGGFKVARWFWLLLVGVLGWAGSYLPPVKALLAKIGG